MSSSKEKEAEAFKKWFSSQKTYTSLSAMERALNITEDYLHMVRDGTRRAINPDLRRKLQEATGLKEFDPITNAPKASMNVATSTAGIRRMPSTSSMQREKELPENLSELLNSALAKLGLTLDRCSQKYGLALGNLKKYKRGVARPASKKNITAVLNILNDAGVVSSQKEPIEKVKISAHPNDISTLVEEVKGLKERIDKIDAKLTTAQLYQDMSENSASSNAEKRARTVMRLLMSLFSELEFFKNCTEDERRVFRKTIPGQDVGYITTLLRALYDEDKFQKWLFFSTYTMKGKGDG